jgi:hypothetical protein
MHRTFRSFLHASVAMLVLAGAAYAAEAELDPPAVDQAAEATTIIHLNVTAGVSGAPNGFAIEWMLASLFDQIGGWPEDPNDTRIQSAIYLGAPSLNVTEGTTSFLLGPGETAKVEIGDIFDETGVLASNLSELAVGAQYVVRVRANGDGGLTGGGSGVVVGEPAHLISPSTYSSTYRFNTKTNDGLEECVHSQGYWKTHPSAWPVSNMRLGNVIYSKNQALVIWNTPAAGNGLISLAHQLMAAKLNIISGAQAPAAVLSAVATADVFINNRIVPPIGNGFLDPSATSNFADILEEFNTEENVDVPCNVVTRLERTSWTRVKAYYR